MRILGIETSCDETSAAIVEDGIKILSNTVSSSVNLHAKTGGIIPETAARKQIEYIIPVIDKALKESDLDFSRVDALAVTIGPGLIGSLLVGVETAKTLSFVLKKPIIPVNHLIGHICANFIRTNFKSEILSPKLPATPYRLNADIEFPAIVLIVSGGHTDLLLMKKHGDLKWLGGTLDDAAGELFDKVGRLLNLPYPGGPYIEKAAENGNPKAFNLPRPIIGSKDFNFSFSGLKTAVLREVKTAGKLTEKIVSDLSASTQQAVVDVLIKKTLKAAEKYNVKSILLSGGVSANNKLREQFVFEIRNLKLDIGLFAPEAQLCADNAAMIASAAYFNYHPIPFSKITANPELYFDQ